MKKFLYYAAIIAAFIFVWLIGAFILAGLNIRGSFPMIVIAALSVGASRLTAALLKNKLNPITATPENNNEIL